MNKFGMETLDAEPQHPLLKNRNIKFMHNKYKEEVFHTIMGEIVEDLICTFPKLVNTSIVYILSSQSATLGCLRIKTIPHLPYLILINNSLTINNVTEIIS